MAHAQTLEAIVLRVIDVGEADRLVVLFTRQRGRIAARAKGVRRLHSRMGGSLQPGAHVTAQVTEGRGGWIVAGASTLGEDAGFPSAVALSRAQEGIEILLALTEDDEPLPGVFDLLHAFLRLCRAERRMLLPFTLRLLWLLGSLPSEEEDPRVEALAPADRALLRRCVEEEEPLAALASAPATTKLADFCRAVLEEHLPRPLRSPAVTGSIADPGRRFLDDGGGVGVRG